MRVAHICPKVILATKYAETKDFAAILASAKFLPQPELRVPIASDTQRQTRLSAQSFKICTGLQMDCLLPHAMCPSAWTSQLACWHSDACARRGPAKGLAAALPAALAARRTSDTKTRDFVSREMLGDFRCKSRSKVDYALATRG